MVTCNNQSDYKRKSALYVETWKHVLGWSDDNFPPKQETITLGIT